MQTIRLTAVSVCGIFLLAAYVYTPMDTQGSNELQLVSIPTSVSRDLTKHAADIVNVIQDGKKDDDFVQSALKLSKTHHGEDSGAAELTKRLKEIHSISLNKKSLSSMVGSAIDISKAHGSQEKKAQKEALSIEKVLLQSKEDMENGEQIQKRAKRRSSGSNWNAFWNSKRSLVSRLADSMPDISSSPSGHTDSDSVHKSPFGAPVPKSRLSAVPDAIRNMWKLLGEDKGGDRLHTLAPVQELAVAKAPRSPAARNAVQPHPPAATAASATVAASAGVAAQSRPAGQGAGGVGGEAVRYFESHQGSGEDLN